VIEGGETSLRCEIWNMEPAVGGSLGNWELGMLNYPQIDPLTPYPVVRRYLPHKMLNPLVTPDEMPYLIATSIHTGLPGHASPIS
jgi:hypothetical protein